MSFLCPSGDMRGPGCMVVLPLLLVLQCDVGAKKTAQVGAVSSSPQPQTETVISLGFLLCVAITQEGSLAQGYGF